jgi:hypothetical protein
VIAPGEAGISSDATPLVTTSGAVHLAAVASPPPLWAEKPSGRRRGSEGARLRYHG